jgi:hypothetical protein
VTERDSFLLRMDGKLLAALRKWSEEEMRSTNAQIEFLLRQALLNAGRLPKNSKAHQRAEEDHPGM